MTKKIYRNLPAKGFLLFGIVVFVALFTGCSQNRGKVEITNKSNEVIVSGTLKVCGQLFLLSKIPSGESFEIFYLANTDSNYSVEINFESGRKILKDIGYVTYGFSLIHDELVISDNDISLINKKTK